jgi:outer membrane protein assembly factor BamB/tetratricopeptide (TPR) repeat protein
MGLHCTWPIEPPEGKVLRMRVVRRAVWLVSAMVAVLFLGTPASAQFGLPNTFELSDNIHLDEADTAAKTHLAQVKAHLANSQWDEAVETLRQVMETYAGKMVPADPEIPLDKAARVLRSVRDTPAGKLPPIDKLQWNEAVTSLETGQQSPKGMVAGVERSQWEQAVAMVRSVLDAPGNVAAVDKSKWNAAVEVLKSAIERHARRNKLRRYINIRDYCHLQIAELPAEALTLYRSRVDPQAHKWYDEALASHNPERLTYLVDQLFCSTWGDDALFALGEFALEQGDYGGARDYWEKILPRSYWDKLSSSLPEGDRPSMKFVYPDTTLPMADVRARLVLVSILEGDQERARDDLLRFRAEFGSASGRMGGRQVQYVDFLTGMLESSVAWPRREASTDWPTFGGSATRSKVLPKSVDIGTWNWTQVLPACPSSDMAYRSPRVGEPPATAGGKDELLSYYPVVVGELVLVNNLYQIRAYKLHAKGDKGVPAWGTKEGSEVIYGPPVMPQDQFNGPRSTLGAPRFTMTVHGSKLFARMGNPVTSSPNEVNHGIQVKGAGVLVCLDLAAEGKLLWEIPPPGENWAFEGSPVCDGTNIYVGLRRSDVRPQAHVACYDAETGQLRWKRFICGGETPGQGLRDEITHNLLTLYRDRLYYNTNLGAVAALSTRDGDVKWITLYPRATETKDLNARDTHFYRDLTPCIYYRGTLLVAPSDIENIIALDAATGMLRWISAPGLPTAVQLLGVGGGNLWCSGDQIYAINVAKGLVSKMPQVQAGSARKGGCGRGVLAGNKVYWATRSTIYVFNQQTGEPEKDYFMITRHPWGQAGGNLLVAGDQLLVTTHASITAYSQFAGTHPKTEDVTRRSNFNESAPRTPATITAVPAARKGN